MSLTYQPEAMAANSDFKSLTVGSTRWIARCDWVEMLLDTAQQGGDGLRLEEWVAAGEARVVKQGAHRTVYRVDSAESAFYVKHYRCPSLSDLARNVLRPTASRREFYKALELARRGVPTIEPIALGESRRAGLVGQNYLVTRAIPRTMSLLALASEFLPRLSIDRQQLLRARLAEALASLCVQLHRAGVFHNDLHGGNILVQLDSLEPDQGGRIVPRLFLVDLPGVRFSAPLDWPASRDSLLMLHSDWSERATVAERWRFWRHYWLERAELRLADRRAAGMEIFGLTRDYGCRVLAGRVKRALRTNRDFHAHRNRVAFGHAVAGYSAADLARLVDDPEQLMSQHWDEPVKLSRASTMVTARVMLDGVSTPVAYKRLQPRHWWKRVADLARRNRALSAWLVGHALLERGIATARPIAVVVPRDWRRLGAGYLATEWIDDALNLHLFLWQVAQLPLDERRTVTRQMAIALGKLIGRMHAWRVSHRDLKGCNLLLSRRGEQVIAYLIDLDGVKIRRRLGYREQVRNLARLAASAEAHALVQHSDRRSFLKAYAQELLPQVTDAKQLWRDVARETRRVLARFKQRGKPVA